MKHAFLDQYRHGHSIVHRLDARAKLIATVAFIVAVTVTPPAAWPVFAALLALVLAAIVTAEVPVGLALRRSMIALPFAIIVAVSIPFTKAGQPVLTVRPFGWTLTVTDQGLLTFWGVVVRSWLSVLAAGVMTATTHFTELLRAMESLGLPKVLVSIISFMYRYIFVLVDEAMRLGVARDSRSADPDGTGGGSIVWRARVLGGMIGTLFLRSYERSERIYAAMLSRGFAGEIRTLKEPPLSPRDVWITAGLIAGLVSVETAANFLW